MYLNSVNMKLPGSLVPDLMNSPEWRAKFLALEKRALEVDGSLGNVLQTALRHMSFAPQRWESERTPRRVELELCYASL